MMKSIGSVIRDLRRSRNLTQEQLAENLNLTAQTISKWENQIGMPDISQIVPIAHFFGVSTDVLFGLESDAVQNEVQALIDDAESKDTYDEEYSLLREALRMYPGDIQLLLKLLSCGQCLLADGIDMENEDRLTIFHECERAGKLILTYSEDLRIRIETTEWMIRLYCEMGYGEPASELAESLPSLIGFNRETAMARISELYAEYDNAATCYVSNIAQLQRLLIHNIVLCANQLALKKDLKKAADHYALAMTISEVFLKQNPVPQNQSLQRNLEQTMKRCKAMMEQLDKSIY